MNESLDKLTKRALRPFALSGAPIQGSTDPETPEPVRPGQYLEPYDSTGDHHLAVSLDANRALLRTLMPIQLNIAVDGRPAGLPVYAAPSDSFPIRLTEKVGIRSDAGREA